MRTLFLTVLEFPNARANLDLLFGMASSRTEERKKLRTHTTSVSRPILDTWRSATNCYTTTAARLLLLLLIPTSAARINSTVGGALLLMTMKRIK